MAKNTETMQTLGMGEKLYRNTSKYILMVKKDGVYHRVAPHGVIFLSEKPSHKEMLPA